MKNKMHRELSGLLFALGLMLSFSTMAASVEKAEAAIAEVLFNNEMDEVTTYNISENGAVDITFPNNTPDEVYGKILRELRSHKDIDSDYLMPGRGGPACSLF